MFYIQRAIHDVEMYCEYVILMGNALCMRNVNLQYIVQCLMLMCNALYMRDVDGQ